jgi:hypothetical protein
MSGPSKWMPQGAMLISDKLREAMLPSDELRGFLARLLGWTSDLAVDHALRSIELGAAHLAHLVLCGAGDLVPIAWALHRRTLGADRPFIVCDPRRRNTPASVRSPANRESGVAALAAAAGGSVCLRGSRLPEDFSSMVLQLRSTGDVQYIVCSDEDDAADPFLVVPAPIRLPSLTDRARELPRIVDGYALDAIAALGAPNTCFTDRDRAWVLEHGASSLSEIERATLRLVALGASTSMDGAAKRLGMAAISLSNWVRRRRLPLPASWGGRV